MEPNLNEEFYSIHMLPHCPTLHGELHCSHRNTHIIQTAPYPNGEMCN